MFLKNTECNNTSWNESQTRNFANLRIRTAHLFLSSAWIYRTWLECSTVLNIINDLTDDDWKWNGTVILFGTSIVSDDKLISGKPFIKSKVHLMINECKCIWPHLNWKHIPRNVINMVTDVPISHWSRKHNERTAQDGYHVNKVNTRNSNLV